MSNIKVKMTPHLSHFRSEVSGIATVVKKWFHYLPQFGIELVKPDAKKYDLVAAHAGMTGPEVDVVHLHGVYWSADYAAPTWEYEVNGRIVQAVRHAKEVTVPSEWTSELFKRDMRFSPHVIGHGVDWDEWQHNEPDEGYILAYGKNRAGTDVCDPGFITALAHRFPYLTFVVTFAPSGAPKNVQAIGLTPHEEFKKIIQRASVVISPIKETWGVMQAESLAAGKPVLGVDLGGNRELIETGVNGYLYEPGNYDDMAEGLAYCLKHRKILGENARETAKALTWEKSIEKLAEVYRLAMVKEPPTVSVVIPVYNKTGEEIKRAIGSCLAQSLKPNEVIVVNDGSQDKHLALEIIETYYNNAPEVRHIYQNNQGVANARNNGIASTRSKYICPLDADDWLEPTFLETCVKALEADRSLGIAYTRLQWHNHQTGETGISDWPGEWDFDRQLKKQNQVPTCCTFRREMWERLGGYRQRYAPGGAGAEDAEFWLRAGAYGWGAKLVTEEALFNYSFGGSVSANKNYVEPDWLAWQPWVKDEKHPFASYATPKKLSHPVTQYDEPQVSVVIPVGPGHEKELINALDSLEAQSFRKWEAIVVDDTGPTECVPKSILTAYPYIKAIKVFGQYGAGYARNRGAELARAPFLLFLDADDTLHPSAIEKMMEKWNETGQAVYTDYVGQAYIEEAYALSLEQKSRLQSFDPKTGEATISYQAFDFDCARALRQPEPGSPYIWNLITTLHPKAWHIEIGGFDEAMDTWEDWDYWLRIVQKGHCFTRLPEQLIRYRFYTGTRRSLASADTTEGRQKAEAMLKYMSTKYERLEVMGCGCKDKGSNGTATIAALQMGVESMADSNFVKARYAGKQGNHHIWGDSVFEHNPGPPARKHPGGGFKFYYGYASRGLETLVYRGDVALKPDNWQVLPEKVNQIEAIIQRPGPPVPMGAALPQPIAMAGQAPQPVAIASQPDTREASFDLQQLPGVGGAIAQRMRAAGLVTREAILEAGLTGLSQIEGVTNTRAVAILKALEN